MSTAGSTCRCCWSPAVPGSSDQSNTTTTDTTCRASRVSNSHELTAVRAAECRVQNRTQTLIPTLRSASNRSWMRAPHGLTALRGCSSTILSTASHMICASSLGHLYNRTLGCPPRCMPNERTEARREHEVQKWPMKAASTAPACTYGRRARRKFVRLSLREKRAFLWSMDQKQGRSLELTFISGLNRIEMDWQGPVRGRVMRSFSDETSRHHARVYSRRYARVWPPRFSLCVRPWNMG